MNREEGEKIYGECYLCGHHGEIEDVCRVDGTHIVGPKMGMPMVMPSMDSIGGRRRTW